MNRSDNPGRIRDELEDKAKGEVKVLLKGRVVRLECIEAATESDLTKGVKRVSITWRWGDEAERDTCHFITQRQIVPQEKILNINRGLVHVLLKDIEDLNDAKGIMKIQQKRNREGRRAIWTSWPVEVKMGTISSIDFLWNIGTAILRWKLHTSSSLQLKEYHHHNDSAKREGETVAKETYAKKMPWPRRAWAALCESCILKMKQLNIYLIKSNDINRKRGRRKYVGAPGSKRLKFSKPSVVI